jgi:SAM-dependent methyltransferase
MSATEESAAPAAAGAQSPEDVLAEVRAQVASGAPLVGALAARFYRAVSALDPAATEDSLAVLPGNRGVQLYETPISWATLGGGEQVLDLGCGSGGATRAAARIVGAEGMVVGIDASSESLREAEARTPDDLPVLYRRGDFHRMANIPDRTFDCALASMVLEQIDDLGPVLTEVARVLRPGGRFVFVEHVGAEAGTRRRRIQRLVRRPWRFVGDGCDLTNDAVAVIGAAGFASVDATARHVGARTDLANPTYWGTATR